MEPDKSKIYMCYHCDETVEWIRDWQKWAHCLTGQVECHTTATPSNIEIDFDIMESTEV